MFKNKNILFITHTYNHFQKDQIEYLSKFFNQVYVIVRYKPIAELFRIFPFSSTKMHTYSVVFNLKNKPENNVEINVNGEQRDVPIGTTITGLLKILELDARPVAVELNRQIVKREEHSERQRARGPFEGLLQGTSSELCQIGNPINLPRRIIK